MMKSMNKLLCADMQRSRVCIALAAAKRLISASGKLYLLDYLTHYNMYTERRDQTLIATMLSYRSWNRDDEGAIWVDESR